MATTVRENSKGLTDYQITPDGVDTSKCQKVLIPLDGSPAGESVLPTIEQLAKTKFPTPVEIVLLHVITPVLFASTDLMVVSGQYIDDQVKVATKQAERYLHYIAEELRLRGIAATITVEIGNPVERIVAVASQSNINLIAMATRGRSGFKRFILGSVTDGVTRSVHLPVLTVRAKSPVQAN